MNKYKASTPRSLGNNGLRVVPSSKSSPYMELHKLEYKRTNLKNKKEKIVKEIALLDEQLQRVEVEMHQILDTVSRLTAPDPKTQPDNSRKLRY